MNIPRLNNSITTFKGGLNSSKISQNIANKFANMSELGEGVSIACDFLGKAVVVPAVIMVASKESKDNKEYSALKNPVAALIQLAFEVPILAFGSKLVENLANKGFFDKKGEAILYNLKLAKENFTDSSQITKVQKNLFHLQNRICFVAALALTPLLCAIEDKLHPKVMDLLYKNRHKKEMAETTINRKNIPDMTQFIKNITHKKQEVK